MTNPDAELSKKLALTDYVLRNLPAHQQVAAKKRVVKSHEEHGQAIREMPAEELVDEPMDALLYTITALEAGIPPGDNELVTYQQLAARLVNLGETLALRVDRARKAKRVTQMPKA